MWIVISFLVFVIVVTIGAFALKAVFQDEDEEDTAKSRPWPPYDNPYDPYTGSNL